MSVLEQKLCSSRLASTNGVVHLPLPTGNYSVGFTDIATPPMGDQKLPLILRLYYPAAAASQDTARWAPWFSHPNYAQGYLRYKFPRLGYLQPLLGSVFAWITGSPSVPVQERLPPLLVAGNQWPVVVMSHGLAACRSTYSFLCYSLASRGYCVAAVEHGDGSACVRTLVDQPDAEPRFLWQELVEPGTPELSLRNKQVKQRAVEVGLALDVLEKIEQGKFADTGAWTLDSSGGQTGEMEWENLKNSLDLDKVAVAGHSFGGATTVLTLATDKRFKSGVALDSWMFPLREENGISSGMENLLFINCETFQTKKNLEVMKRFEVELENDSFPSSNVLTILGASHHSPTDIPTIFKGAGWLSSYLLPGGGGSTDGDGLDPYTTLLLNLELLDSWFQNCQKKKSSKFINTVNLNQNYLGIGINN